jgi:hypothetical protein
MSTPLLVQLKERVGQEVHLSDWLTVGQARINAFAEAIISGSTSIPRAPRPSRPGAARSRMAT